SNIATPPPIVSSRYFTEVGEPACLKSSFKLAVMSLNVTGDSPCGPAGGGVFGKSAAVYARPVRGVGDGDGPVCCPTTLTQTDVRLITATMIVFVVLPGSNFDIVTTSVEPQPVTDLCHHQWSRTTYRTILSTGHAHQLLT